MRKCSLDVQLFVVLAHCSSFCGQGVQHHSRIDEIFLHTLKPCIQLLKPHQLSCIWGKQKAEYSQSKVISISSKAVKSARRKMYSVCNVAVSHR